MPGKYENLAPLYIKLGLDQFAQIIVPRLVNYAMSSGGWMGRRIMDVGCGTGASLEWLGRHGYVLGGMDISTEMISIARENGKGWGTDVRWIEDDIRHLTTKNLDPFDMVLAINTLNEMGSLRELEAAFKNIYNLLQTGKLLAFDLYTIQGLIETHQSGEQLFYHDANDLIVFTTSQFDYERQVQQQKYIIFENQQNTWHHTEAQFTLRAYPIQAVTALLQRCGFQIFQVLTLNFDPYSPVHTQPARVIIMATKQ